MKRFFIYTILLLLILSGSASATTYWVDDNGAASWASCTGATPLSGTAACPASAVAGGSVSAGDTVYLRAGTYNVYTQYATGLNLNNKSGSVGSPVTVMAYNNEAVEFVGTYGTRMWGMTMDQTSYLILDGIIFTDFTDNSIRGITHHVEIKNCTFRNVTSPYSHGTLPGGVLNINDSCDGYDRVRCPSHDIWIHDCVFNNLNAGACSGTSYTEGGEALRFGYYGITCDTHATSTSTVAFGTGVKVFTLDAAGVDFGQISTGLPITDFVMMAYEPTTQKTMQGHITDYTDTTLTVDVWVSNGSGTYSNWQIKACASGNIRNITVENNILHHGGHSIIDTYGKLSVFRNNVLHNEPWYPDPQCGTPAHASDYINDAYDGLYSHRVMQITDTFDSTQRLNLIEDSRYGYAGVNPNNNGASGLTVAAPGNIIRGNKIYANMNFGGKWKYGYTYGWQAEGGCYNKMYNNSFYHNGYGYAPYQNTAGGDIAIGWRNYSNSTEPGNSMKNNVFWDSYGATTLGLYDMETNTSTPPTEYANNWGTVNDANKLCSGCYGNPGFLDTDVSDPYQYDKPGLQIDSSSPLFNKGGPLTYATNSGSSETSLQVNDSWYFQYGQIGAQDTNDNPTVDPDYIAVGSVTNISAISSINYTTHTITLATPLTWSSSDPVYLKYNSSGRDVLKGTMPDIGAYETDATDTTAPVMSNPSPAGAVYDCTIEPPNNHTISISTNEAATCKFDVTDTDYDSMAYTFTTTGGTSHSRTMYSLSCDDTYTYYVRCSDAYANKNTSSATIYFTINAEPPPPAGAAAGPRYIYKEGAPASGYNVGGPQVFMQD